MTLDVEKALKEGEKVLSAVERDVVEREAKAYAAEIDEKERERILALDLDRQAKALRVNGAPRVYAAIANVMADIGASGIAKDRNNQQQGYRFRGIDDVYNALSTPLSARGLMMLPRVLHREQVERQTKSGSPLFYVCLDVEYDIVCAEDCSKHTVRVVGEAMDSADKASNKAMSAAYKYACMQVFCIPTEGDNDADATTHEVAPPRPLAQPSAAATHGKASATSQTTISSTASSANGETSKPRTEEQRKRIGELIAKTGITLDAATKLAIDKTGVSSQMTVAQAGVFIAALEVFGAT